MRCGSYGLFKWIGAGENGEDVTFLSVELLCIVVDIRFIHGLYSFPSVNYFSRFSLGRWNGMAPLYLLLVNFGKHLSEFHCNI
jgi:hypothetical protein